MKTEPIHHTETAIDLSSALIMTGNKLKPQPEKEILLPEEVKFKSQKELEELVVDNSKILFGQHTVLFELKDKYVNGGLLFDLKEPRQPKPYFVDIASLKKEFYADIFPKVTKLFSLLSTTASFEGIVGFFGKSVEANKALKKDLLSKAGCLDLLDYLGSMMMDKPRILLISDGEREDLSKVMEIYSTTWGRQVTPIVIRKFSQDGTLFCLMEPSFSDVRDIAELQIKRAREKHPRTIRQATEKLTEANHLENASVDVKGMYEKIKTDLLEADGSLEFNPQRHYISLRKGRNLAFFHIRKNLISLVVMNPLKETRKEIKSYTVKELKESVQKFWNGACCTLLIDRSDKLEEVTALLKQMITQ